MNKNIFKLARLLKLLTEVMSDKGVLVSEGNMEVGTEVFVYNEQGEAIPVPDGDYIVDENITIVVANGIVSEIRMKEEEPIEQPEEQPETEEEVVEIVEEEITEDTPEEEAAEEAAEADIEAMKAEIEALKSENESLKAENEELKNKISEMKKAVEPSIEEEDKQEFSKTAGLNDKQKRVANILKYRNENKE